MTKKTGQSGFAVGGIIALVLVFGIMMILIMLYFRSSGNREAPAQIGQKAIEDAEKVNNQLYQQQQEQLKVQNEINGIN